MSLVKLISAMVLSLLFAACATGAGTVYGPANERGYGFSDFRVESNRYRVTFSGDGATSRDQVEAYALRRAAELTDQNGYDWFLVVFEETYGDVRGGANVGLGFGSGSFGRRGGVGVGVGGDVGRVGGRQYYTTRLEILLGNGDKPEDEQRVYDAKGIIDAVEAPPVTETEQD
ncbi:MAG: hypothetical protein AAGH38_01945 [Pseudomonadota bacterium]